MYHEMNCFDGCTNIHTKSIYIHLQATKLQSLCRAWMVRKSINKCLDTDPSTPVRTLENSLCRLQNDFDTLSTPSLRSILSFEYEFIYGIYNQQLINLQATKIQSLCRGWIVRKTITKCTNIDPLTPSATLSILSLDAAPYKFGPGLRSIKKFEHDYIWNLYWSRLQTEFTTNIMLYNKLFNEIKHFEGTTQDESDTSETDHELISCKQNDNYDNDNNDYDNNDYYPSYINGNFNNNYDINDKFINNNYTDTKHGPYIDATDNNDNDMYDVDHCPAYDTNICAEFDKDNSDYDDIDYINDNNNNDEHDNDRTNDHIHNDNDKDKEVHNIPGSSNHLYSACVFQLNHSFVRKHVSLTAVDLYLPKTKIKFIIPSAVLTTLLSSCTLHGIYPLAPSTPLCSTHYYDVNHEEATSYGILPILQPTKDNTFCNNIKSKFRVHVHIGCSITINPSIINNISRSSNTIIPCHTLEESFNTRADVSNIDILFKRYTFNHFVLGSRISFPTDLQYFAPTLDTHLPTQLNSNHTIMFTASLENNNTNFYQNGNPTLAHDIDDTFDSSIILFKEEYLILVSNAIVGYGVIFRDLLNQVSPILLHDVSHDDKSGDYIPCSSSDSNIDDNNNNDDIYGHLDERIMPPFINNMLFGNYGSSSSFAIANESMGCVVETINKSTIPIDIHAFQVDNFNVDLYIMISDHYDTLSFDGLPPAIGHYLLSNQHSVSSSTTNTTFTDVAINSPSSNLFSQIDANDHNDIDECNNNHASISNKRSLFDKSHVFTESPSAVHHIDTTSPKRSSSTINADVVATDNNINSHNDDKIDMDAIFQHESTLSISTTMKFGSKILLFIYINHANTKYSCACNGKSGPFSFNNNSYCIDDYNNNNNTDNDTTLDTYDDADVNHDQTNHDQDIYSYYDDTDCTDDNTDTTDCTDDDNRDNDYNDNNYINDNYNDIVGDSKDNDNIHITNNDNCNNNDNSNYATNEDYEDNRNNNDNTDDATDTTTDCTNGIIFICDNHESTIDLLLTSTPDPTNNPNTNHLFNNYYTTSCATDTFGNDINFMHIHHNQDYDTTQSDINANININKNQTTNNKNQTLNDFTNDNDSISNQKANHFVINNNSNSCANKETFGNDNSNMHMHHDDTASCDNLIIIPPPVIVKENTLCNNVEANFGFHPTTRYDISIDPSNINNDSGSNTLYLNHANTKYSFNCKSGHLSFNASLLQLSTDSIRQADDDANVGNCVYSHNDNSVMIYIYTDIVSYGNRSLLFLSTCKISYYNMHQLQLKACRILINAITSNGTWNNYYAVNLVGGLVCADLSNYNTATTSTMQNNEVNSYILPIILLSVKHNTTTATTISCYVPSSTTITSYDPDVLSKYWLSDIMIPHDIDCFAWTFVDKITSIYALFLPCIATIDHHTVSNDDRHDNKVYHSNDKGSNTNYPVLGNYGSKINILLLHPFHKFFGKDNAAFNICCIRLSSMPCYYDHHPGNREYYDLMKDNITNHFDWTCNVPKSTKLLFIENIILDPLLEGELSSDKGVLSPFPQFVSERQIKLVRYYSIIYYKYVKPRFITYLHSLAREK